MSKGTFGSENSPINATVDFLLDEGKMAFISIKALALKLSVSPNQTSELKQLRHLVDETIVRYGKELEEIMIEWKFSAGTRPPAVEVVAALLKQKAKFDELNQAADRLMEQFSTDLSQGNPRSKKSPRGLRDWEYQEVIQICTKSEVVGILTENFSEFAQHLGDPGSVLCGSVELPDLLYGLLALWKSRHGRKATTDALMSVFIKCNLSSVADDIKRFYTLPEIEALAEETHPAEMEEEVQEEEQWENLQALLGHAIFMDLDKIADFLVDFTDSVRNVKPIIADIDAHLPKVLNQMGNNWLDALPDDIQKILPGQTRIRYNGNKLISLLRAIRNIIVHNFEIKGQIPDFECYFGPNGATSVAVWMQIFPNLVPFVYSFFQKHKRDPSFGGYMTHQFGFVEMDFIKYSDYSTIFEDLCMLIGKEKNRVQGSLPREFTVMSDVGSLTTVQCLTAVPSVFRMQNQLVVISTSGHTACVSRVKGNETLEPQSTIPTAPNTSLKEEIKFKFLWKNNTHTYQDLSCSLPDMQIIMCPDSRLIWEYLQKSNYQKSAIYAISFPFNTLKGATLPTTLTSGFGSELGSSEIASEKEQPCENLSITTDSDFDDKRSEASYCHSLDQGQDTDKSPGQLQRRKLRFWLQNNTIELEDLAEFYDRDILQKLHSKTKEGPPNIIRENQHDQRAVIVPRFLKSRNHFTFSMIMDPTLQQSEIILRVSTRNAKPVKETTSKDGPHDPAFVQCIKPLAVKTDEQKDENSRTRHTFEEHPTKDVFQWVSTEPAGQFHELQHILMKHGVYSDPVPEKKLLPAQESPRSHFLISGEAGSGKSTLLKKLGKKMMNLVSTFSKSPIVALIRFPNLMKSVVSGNSQGSKITKMGLAKAVAKEISSSPIWESFVSQLITGYGGYQFYLLLDALDEVGSDMERSLGVLELIQQDFPNVSVFVTARPQLVLSLENILQTFAYNLEPVDSTNQFHLLQINLLCQLGQRPGKYEDYVPINDVGLFAKHCVENYGELLKTPVAVEMFAEVAREFFGSEQQQVKFTELHLLEQFFALKFGDFNDDEHKRLKTSLRHEAFRVLCPELTLLQEYSSFICEDLKTEPPPKSKAQREIFSAKIAEYVASQAIYEALQTDRNEATRSWLGMFIEKYYIMDPAKTFVSKMDNGRSELPFTFLSLLHHVFAFLNEMLVTKMPRKVSWLSSCFDDDTVANILITAGIHNHLQIAKLCTPQCSKLSGDDSVKQKFGPCLRSILTQNQFDINFFKFVCETVGKLASVEFMCELVLHELNEFVKSNEDEVWSVHLMWSRLFLNERNPSILPVIREAVEHLTTYAGLEKHVKKCGNGSEIWKSAEDILLQLLKPISIEQLAELKMPTRNLLKLIFSNNASIFSKIPWNNLRCMQLTLNLNIPPSEFKHQNLHLQDLYRLITRLPTNYKTLREETINYVEPGLKAYTFKFSDLSEMKVWYAKLYENVLDHIYQRWLRKHDFWWDSRRFSKNKFLECVASVALDSRFPNQSFKDIFEVDEEYVSVDELVELKLITRGSGKKNEKGESKKHHFFHDTIADYLIAWLITNVKFGVSLEKFSEFLLGHVLKVTNPVSPGDMLQSDEEPLFDHFFICYFLDELVDNSSELIDYLEYSNIEYLKDLPANQKNKNDMIHVGLQSTLLACLKLRFPRLLYLFGRESYTVLFEKFDPEVHNTILFLILEEVCVHQLPLAVTMIHSAKKLELLESAKNFKNETFREVASRAAAQTCFKETLLQAFDT